MIGVDLSLSAHRVVPATDSGLELLADWLPYELRPEDELAVIDFAEAARLRLAPTPVSARPRPSPREILLQHCASQLASLGQQASALGQDDLDTVLVVLSDKQLADAPRNSEDFLARTGLRSVRMTGLALAAAVADLTGRALVVR